MQAEHPPRTRRIPSHDNFQQCALFHLRATPGCGGRTDEQIFRLKIAIIGKPKKNRAPHFCDARFTSKVASNALVITNGIGTADSIDNGTVDMDSSRNDTHRHNTDHSEGRSEGRNRDRIGAMRLQRP